MSIYQDDVFYDDQRMMRVLSLDQLRGIEPLPSGQAETEAEFGRFFFDYDNDAVYINQDPTFATVDMTVLTEIFESDQRDVELRHLTLEKALDTVVFAGSGQSWQIIDTTIRFAHNIGLYVGRGTETKPFLIQDSLVTNNGQAGIVGGAKYLEVRGTEISWNNIANYREKKSDGSCGILAGTGGARVFGTDSGSPTQPALIVDDVYAHHNLTDGFHVDIHAQYVTVTNSRFHHNERSGYFHEISCEAEVAFNDFAGNGTEIKSNGDMIASGLAIVLSNHVWAHDNVFRRNDDRSIYLSHFPHANMDGVPCMDETSDTDVSDALKHNVIENNRVFMCDGKSGGFVPDTLAERDNWFRGNRYLIPSDSDGKHFHDTEGAGNLTWDEWQAQGQDPDGEIYFHAGRCTRGQW